MVRTGSAGLFLAGADVISVECTASDVSNSEISNNGISRTRFQTNIDNNNSKSKKIDYHHQHEWQIVWRNVLLFAVLHSAAVYGLYIALTSTKLYTIFFLYIVGVASALGITAGAHRLWAHKCYKAKWPLRLILAIFQTVAFQNHIYEWVRDHRVHHKFTDTDADPHNSKRGFFFSHMGWLLMKKHKDVIEKGKSVDLSDLEKDPIVMWQKKYYGILVPIFTFILPASIPWYLWNEKWMNAFFTVSVLRYALALNFTWLVNSAAHIWGMKPYDKNISAAENVTVAVLTFGEGWHNYHHVFPWDYKAAELGSYGFNFSTAFIDFFAYIGWAYDLKMATQEMVVQRAKRTGDGTLQLENDVEIWGWDDEDMTVEDKNMVNISHRIIPFEKQK